MFYDVLRQLESHLLSLKNLQVSGSLEYTDSYGEVAQVAEKRYVAEVPWRMM